MFYIVIQRDQGEPLYFTCEAPSAAFAVRIAGAYCKGMFEASGHGGEIVSVSKAKTRGVEYRGL